MSNLPQVENLKQIVVRSEIDFIKLAKANGVSTLDFAKEASFAIQLLTKNTFLQGIAMGNQDSLKYAVLNVAAIGLSLNPVHKMAYLVPRNKEVCLDISYIGLIKLATDTGSVKLVKAELVHKKDKFKYKGLGKEPLHEFNPFEDRGEFVGAYCVAITNDNKYIVEMMTANQINGIKARSEAAKRNSGPWITDFEEMARKTVVKRAAKYWPKTKLSNLLDQAIDVTNQAEPIELEASPLPKNESSEDRQAKLDSITELLIEYGRSENQYKAHLNTSLNRKIESLSDLTDLEIEQQLILLTERVNEKKAKELKENENKTANTESN